MEQYSANEVIEQTFAARGYPVVDRAESLNREVAIFKRTHHLPCLRRSSVHKTGQEGTTQSVSNTGSCMFTKQILRHHGLLLSVGPCILPMADEEAHVFQKGSPFLETRIIGASARIGCNLTPWPRPYAHVLCSSSAVLRSISDHSTLRGTNSFQAAVAMQTTGLYCSTIFCY